MMTVMYIHGYGSTGNATKGQLLRGMLADCRVVSPTFDYDHSTPWEIQEQIARTVMSEKVEMMVGSSFGGYHALCATSFFRGLVWVVNPVHDVVSTIRRIIAMSEVEGGAFLDMYDDFNNKVFQPQSDRNRSGDWPPNTSLNMALSTDDELLGDHHPLLDLFPCHDHVVWKDHCGHRFFRFEELKTILEQSIAENR